MYCVKFRTVFGCMSWASAIHDEEAGLCWDSIEEYVLRA